VIVKPLFKDLYGLFGEISSTFSSSWWSGTTILLRRRVFISRGTRISFSFPNCNKEEIEKLYLKLIYTIIPNFFELICSKDSYEYTLFSAYQTWNIITLIHVQWIHAHIERSMHVITTFVVYWGLHTFLDGVEPMLSIKLVTIII
jgi:hypothetical protein